MEQTAVLKNEKMEALFKLCARLANLPVVGTYFGDFPWLVRMMEDYRNGTYRELPLASMIAVAFALIYFALPVDLVPDRIPVIGQLDNVIVLTLVAQAVHNDIGSYRKWVQES